MSEPLSDRDDEKPRASLQRTARRVADRIEVLSDLRQHWWNFLNALEASRALRMKIYVSVFFILALSVMGAWAYPRWRENRAIGVARQWTSAGKLERAGPAVEAALREAPDNPASWAVAADYARRANMASRAEGYARRAAQLAPGRSEPMLTWASYALAAGRNDAARDALGHVPPAELAASAWGQRLLGEVARRTGEAGAARANFETALRLGGPDAENEIPLGLVLLTSEVPADKTRGATLLGKWTGDAAAGAEAIRPLLEDAVVRDDRDAMLRWAEALRAHPAHTRQDSFNGLLVFSRIDLVRFHAVLAELEESFAADSSAVAQLLTWLTGNKWLPEAKAWIQTLPETITATLPVVSQIAELDRVAADWPALRRVTEMGDWTPRLDFLRQAYAALAARELGETARAESLWRGLRGSAEIKGGQGFFLGGVLYTWGWRDEAVELWWLASEQGGVAIEALGALARHYQVTGDAAGSLKVFRRLYNLREHDDAIANNYLYFEALAGQPTRTTREIAREIHERQPREPHYRSTYAFVLLRQGAAAEALTLLAPEAATAQRELSLAFTYGLVLAANGRKAEAETALKRVEPKTLNSAERALLKSALTP